MAKLVYTNCPTSIFYKVTLSDLVKLDMTYFDIILSTNWLHACYASTYCKTKWLSFSFLTSQS